MLAAETTTIVARLHLAGLLPIRDPAAVQVWHEDIGHLDYPTALDAARWLTQHRDSGAYGPAKPADLLDAVKAVRRQRINDLLGNAPVPEPPAEIDPDDVPRYLAWRKAWVDAAGNGASVAQANDHADHVLGITRAAVEQRTRPVAAIVAGVGRGIGAS